MPPLSLPASPAFFAEGAHSRPDKALSSVRATGDTLGSYAESIAVAATASATATSLGAIFPSSASEGVLPTRAHTMRSAFSATRLPNRDLHSVWKSVSPAVMPSKYRTRSSSAQDARSFSITRLHLASIDSAISWPTASSSAFPARTVRSSTSSGVSGSFSTSFSIS